MAVKWIGRAMSVSDDEAAPAPTSARRSTLRGVPAVAGDVPGAALSKREARERTDTPAGEEALGAPARVSARVDGAPRPRETYVLVRDRASVREERPFGAEGRARSSPPPAPPRRPPVDVRALARALHAIDTSATPANASQRQEPVTRSGPVPALGRGGDDDLEAFLDGVDALVEEGRLRLARAMVQDQLAAHPGNPRLRMRLAAIDCRLTQAAG